jgi:hypothetical protein
MVFDLTISFHFINECGRVNQRVYPDGLEGSKSRGQVVRVVGHALDTHLQIEYMMLEGHMYCYSYTISSSADTCDIVRYVLILLYVMSRLITYFHKGPLCR